MRGRPLRAPVAESAYAVDLKSASFVGSNPTGGTMSKLDNHLGHRLTVKYLSGKVVLICKDDNQVIRRETSRNLLPADTTLRMRDTTKR